MAQRFKAAPQNFEPTPEEVDAVLHDVFTAMDQAERNKPVAPVADPFEPEYCYACGRANSPDASECSVCHADFNAPVPEPAPDYVTCSSCGSSYGVEWSGYIPGAVYCPDCGNFIGCEDDEDDYYAD